MIIWKATWVSFSGREVGFEKAMRLNRAHAAGFDFFGHLSSCGPFGGEFRLEFSRVFRLRSPSLSAARLLFGYWAAHWLGGVCRPPLHPEVQLLPNRLRRHKLRVPSRAVHQPLCCLPACTRHSVANYILSSGVMNGDGTVQVIKVRLLFFYFLSS